MLVSEKYLSVMRLEFDVSCRFLRMYQVTVQHKALKSEAIFARSSGSCALTDHVQISRVRSDLEVSYAGLKK